MTTTTGTETQRGIMVRISVLFILLLIHACLWVQVLPTTPGAPIYSTSQANLQSSLDLINAQLNEHRDTTSRILAEINQLNLRVGSIEGNLETLRTANASSGLQVITMLQGEAGGAFRP
jgi:hypothetical protein